MHFCFCQNKMLPLRNGPCSSIIKVSKLPRIPHIKQRYSNLCVTHFGRISCNNYTLRSDKDGQGRGPCCPDALLHLHGMLFHNSSCIESMMVACSKLLHCKIFAAACNQCN